MKAKLNWHFEEGKIYAVEWLDHYSLIGSWRGNEDFEEFAIKSIGFCMKNSDTMVRIASHVDPWQKFTGDIAIIKACIVNAWELTGI